MAASAAGTMSARAADRYAVDSGSQNWSNGSNWSTTEGGTGGAGVPGNGDNAFITGNNGLDGTPSFVTYDDNYSSPGLASLTVDSSYRFASGLPDASSLTQSSASTSLYATSVVLGDTNATAGFGTFNQSAGTNTFGSLIIYTGGDYELSGGSLTVGSLSNTGNFNVSNGATFTTTGTVSGTGTVQYSGNANLAGGTISAPLQTAPNTTITKTTSAPEIISGTQSYGANTTYEADLGTTTFLTPFGSSSGTATLFVHANTTAIHVNLGSFTGGPHLSWAGGFSANTPGEVILDAGTQEVLGSNALSIDVADGGSMDINDNTFILEDSDTDHNAAKTAQLTSWLAVGFSGGGWNGLGIKSTVAAQTPGHELGILNNDNGSGGALYTTFHGASVDAHSVLIQYTYAGDADLSGTLTSIDFNDWLNGFQNDLGGWSNGCFSYDSAPDIADDFKLLAEGWNAEYGNDAALQSLVNSSSLTAPQQSQADAIINSVPEPSSAALAAIAICGLTSRRRRRVTIKP